MKNITLTLTELEVFKLRLALIDAMTCDVDNRESIRALRNKIIKQYDEQIGE